MWIISFGLCSDLKKKQKQNENVHYLKKITVMRKQCIGMFAFVPINVHDQKKRFQKIKKKYPKINKKIKDIKFNNFKVISCRNFLCVTMGIQNA